MPRLLQRVTDHAVALLGAEHGFVVLMSDRGTLEAHAARDRAGGDDPHANFSRSVAERVVAKGEPVVTLSARDDERLAEAVSVHQLMIQSIACVPIRGAPPVGRTIGALYVETRLRPGLRFEQELPTLSAFADQAAIAIENARLLAENRERADELARANVELALGARRARTPPRQAHRAARGRAARSRSRCAPSCGATSATRASSARARRCAASTPSSIASRTPTSPCSITGESGTGKEMVAKAVHQSGARAKKPFLGVNCGAIPANLLESELFGHVRGAFTGADRDRRGLFQEADGGTLLLDEIGEMPQKMQAGLLRVLQEKQVRPVGGTKEEPVDVRVIAATNRDLEADGRRRHVPRGSLLPPARRRASRPAAARAHRGHSRRSSTTFFPSSPRATGATERRCRATPCGGSAPTPGPGNVRQLEHVLLSAWLMAEGTEIAVADVELPALPANVGRVPAGPERASPGVRGASNGRAATKQEFKASERDRILSALTACNWNRVRAAKMIGLPRRTFYRRLKEFGIV